MRAQDLLAAKAKLTSVIEEVEETTEEDAEAQALREAEATKKTEEMMESLRQEHASELEGVKQEHAQVTEAMSDRYGEARFEVETAQELADERASELQDVQQQLRSSSQPPASQQIPRLRKT